VARITRFVRESVDAGEPVLVAVPAARLELLRAPIADLHDHVRMLDMVDVGANPGRIIGMWSDFLETTGGQPSRGVGEVIRLDRDEQQLVECRIHDRLLDLAFAGRSFTLLSALDTAVEDGASALLPSGSIDVFSVPLPPSPGGARALDFSMADLSRTRASVRAAAEAAGVTGTRLADLVLSVDEVATNALVHGRADGVVRWWTEGGRFTCEISGGGTFVDPLVGRLRAGPDQPGGRGLWLANHLCDLVQVRNVDGGTVVRLRVDLDD
jgi:anti-sigma regulatory factor (Ser/Thr protein kinase)